MADAFSLLEEASKLNRKYFDMFSSSDLDAIENNDLAGLSDEGVKIFEKARTDLGKGEYLDTATSILGAVGTGAAAGAAFGPVGAAVGGVVGGALGAFGGELIEDKIAGRKADLYGALRSGGESVLWDVGLLGTGRLVRPLFKVKKSRMPTLDELSSNFADAGGNTVLPGTTESLASTQQMLQSANKPATLLRGQVDELSIGGRIAESVARSGLISSNMVNKNAEAAAIALKDNMNNYVREALKESGDTGELVFNVLQEGRRASQELYGAKLAQAKELLPPNKVVGTSNIRASVRSFIKEHRTGWLNTLDAGTKRQAKSIDQLLKPKGAEKRALIDAMMEQGLSEDHAARLVDMQIGRGATGETLMEFHQYINQIISDYMPGNARANANTVRGLTKLSKTLRGAIRSTLDEISPAARQVFEEANDMYSEASKALELPAIPALVSKGDVKDFHVAAKTILQADSPDKVRQVYTGMRKAFELMKKQGIEPPIGSYDDAVKVVRASYAQDIFKSFLNQPLGELPDAANKALSMVTDPSITKAVMGDDWVGFSRVLNAMVETNAVSKNALQAGSLAVRSKEISGSQLLATGLIAGNLPINGLVAGAAIFTVPAVLAKIAMRPKAVATLIRQNSVVAEAVARGAPTEEIAALTAAAVGKVFSALPRRDVAILEEELHQYGLVEE
jgi:hypothetical protein